MKREDNHPQLTAGHWFHTKRWGWVWDAPVLDARPGSTFWGDSMESEGPPRRYAVTQAVSRRQDIGRGWYLVKDISPESAAVRTLAEKRTSTLAQSFSSPSGPSAVDYARDMENISKFQSRILETLVKLTERLDKLEKR